METAISTQMTMTQRAKHLSRLKNEKAQLEAQAKDIGQQIEETESLLVSEMERGEVEKFSCDGVTYYIKSSVYANLPAENRDIFIRRLRARKMGDIVKPTINTNTLNAFVREKIVEAGGALPKWMEGLVTTYTKTGIGTHKNK